MRAVKNNAKGGILVISGETRLYIHGSWSDDIMQNDMLGDGGIERGQRRGARL